MQKLGIQIHRVAVATLLAVPTILAGAEIGDERALTFHVVHADIADGLLPLDTVLSAGRHLFEARFTTWDGAGRPGATGSGQPTRRPLEGARSFLRTSGPDATSCAGCHHQPVIGGGGEFVANVFVGAQEREPVLLSVSGEFSAERGTTEMFGAGLIELLAREMTGELRAQRDRALEQAAGSGHPVRQELRSKGVAFGALTAFPNGEVRLAEVEGVDKDLVIRPWSQKGVVTSLRTFTVTALNHHHGMQASERFGLGQTGSRDFDRDGHVDELTDGDVTALVLFQATLPPPRQVLPEDPARRAAVARGEERFARLGCEDCHRSRLVLEDPVFREPGPYNLEGTGRMRDLAPVVINLRELPGFRHLERTASGGLVVRLFSDLKRHRIADPAHPFFANEIVTQGFAPTDQFLTRRLWAVGDTGPYGHRGDVTTLNEVIRLHGGEAIRARLAYEGSSETERREVVEFLKSQLAVGNSEDGPAAGPTGADLARLQERWLEKATTDALRQRQLEDRVQAAVRRAENGAQRALVFALRAENEALRVARVPGQSLTLEVGPDAAGWLAERRSEAAFPPEVDRLINLAVRARQALLATRDAAGRALSAASFAHPGAVDVPVGRLDARKVREELQDALGRGDFDTVLASLSAWCEETAFRAEQLTQQAAMASLRSEAEARRLTLARGE